MNQPKIISQDEHRKRIIDFFNNDWHGRKKEMAAVNVTSDLASLLDEYARIFATKMSRAQILGFLVKRELDQIKGMNHYNGEFLPCSLVMQREKHKLVKAMPGGYEEGDEDMDENLDEPYGPFFDFDEDPAEYMDPADDFTDDELLAGLATTGRH